MGTTAEGIRRAATAGIVLIEPGDITLGCLGKPPAQGPHQSVGSFPTAARSGR
jgi:hypothetical protein